MNDFLLTLYKSLSENVLSKMTIYLLYFKDVYDVNLWEKKLAEVWLINAEQMSLYNFIILRKKETPTQLCFPVKFMKLSRTVVVASENI